MIAKLFTKLWNTYQLASDPIAFARRRGVEVGEGCRFYATTPETFGSEPFLIRLGNYVTVAGGVQFVTHDGAVWAFRKEDPDIDVFGPITVGDYAFIGLRAIILPGVNIGEYAVVGVGAVVTKDVEPRTVVAGVPARKICTLEEYHAKIESKAMHIHNLSPEEKVKVLREHFGM